MILHTVDAITENYVTNSWCFTDMLPGTDDAAIVTLLKDFYDDIAAAYWSNLIAQNGHEVKLYDLPGTVPNYPYFEGTFNMASAPSGQALPGEIALCLSFQGVRSAGFPQARRRGRVYIGPLSTACNSGGRPIAAVMTAMGTAAATLRSQAAVISGTGGWAVWSVTDAAPVEVDNGWIDNAFDVQRRRGVDATSRTTF